MTLPHWRITCIFVDRDCRKMGLSFFALNGALELIKDLGGGVIESYPRIRKGRKYRIRSYTMAPGIPLKKLASVTKAIKGKIIVL